VHFLSIEPLVHLFPFYYHVFFQDAIFRVVAGILHLGNIEFSEGKETDSSIPKDEKSRFHLRTAAELFMYFLFSEDYIFVMPDWDQMVS